MRNRESFNDAAELYNEVRPSYPDGLIDWIIEKTQLQSTDNLLEIAPGTGQCTRKFSERNFSVHTVELGDNLAALLLDNLKNKGVTVDVSSFEDWVPPRNKKYKLIFCATAWHWIDPSVKYEKTRRLLEENGRLAIIWNNALDGDDNEIMKQAYELLFSYHQETPHSTKPKTVEEVKSQELGTRAMLEESGDYLLEDVYEETWSLLQSKDKIIKGFYSQSSFLSLCEDDKTKITTELSVLFAKLEPKIETYFKSVCYLLKQKK